MASLKSKPEVKAGAEPRSFGCHLIPQRIGAMVPLRSNVKGWRWRVISTSFGTLLSEPIYESRVKGRV